MNDVLSQIVARKRERVEASRSKVPLSDLRARVGASGTRYRLRDALSHEGINVIAEIKRRSPSKGVIRADFDPAAIARNYTRGGARAISVLTEEDFFDGSLDHLLAVREVTDLPLLRKDFIFDEYQVYEAAGAGADAILLIGAVLDNPQLSDLLHIAGELGLDALVEVHDRTEVDRVLKFDVQLVGVNNRDLTTFVTDLETSIQLAGMLTKSQRWVSESGIRTRSDIARLREAGYDAVLIGEELMRSGDEHAALRQLTAPAD